MRLFLHAQRTAYDYSGNEVNKQCLRRVTRAKMLALAAAAAARGDGRPVTVADTVVRRSFRHLFLQRHIPVLDCDDPGRLNAALESLASRGLRRRVIQSRESGDRYWVIIDAVLPFKAALHLAECTPGVDTGYLSIVRRWKRFMLRTTPDIDRRPRFLQFTRFQNPLVQQWYSEFCSLYNSAVFEHVLATERLFRRIGSAQTLQLPPQLDPPADPPPLAMRHRRTIEYD